MPSRSSKSSISWGSGLLSLLVLASAAGCGVRPLLQDLGHEPIASSGGSLLRGSTSASSGPIEGARALSLAFQAISKQVAPSVVRIEAFALDEAERLLPLGEGSGVVLSADGVIVTNYHVVRNAEGVLAVLTDGQRFSAEIVGRDPESDLAVLRVEAEGLSPAALRSEDPPRVGEWVLAMGNPLGLGHTVTAGIVSALGRAGLDLAIYEDFIQTDAAINPGNSGGPLVDLDGRVIGINTAMARQSSGSGIGFAIPAEMVREVVDDILAVGRVERGWLGVEMSLLSDGGARRLSYSGDSRVAIGRVLSGGPAQEGGLQAGDIVESIAGQKVESDRDLLHEIARIRPGTGVAIEVWRSGKQLEFQVVLADRASENKER